MRIGMTILATSIVVGMAGKIMICEFASLNVSPTWSESKRVPYSPTGQGPYQQHIFMTQTVNGKTSLPDCVLIPASVAPQVMTKLTWRDHDRTLKQQIFHGIRCVAPASP